MECECQHSSATGRSSPFLLHDLSIWSLGVGGIGNRSCDLLHPPPNSIKYRLTVAALTPCVTIHYFKLDTVRITKNDASQCDSGT